MKMMTTRLMTTVQLRTAVRTRARTAIPIGVFALAALLLSGCGGSGRVHGSASGSGSGSGAGTHSTAASGTAPTTVPPPAPTTTPPTAVPATVITPLYLGNGLGIVAEAGASSGGCSELLATTDFTHWRNISPPQQSGTDGSCPDIWQSASFVSPLQGWVLGRNGGGVNTLLYRTDNGGTTWVQLAGSSEGSNGGTQVIGFTSAEDGWRQQFATGSNAFYLLETTADGGESWSGIPQFSTNGGCEFAVDAFANSLDGFAGNNLAPGATSSLGAPPPQAFLWRTTDGGMSWHEATAPAPPATTNATAFYGLPTFFSPTSGILPVEYVQNGKNGAAGATGPGTLDFYATTNSGSTWALATSVRITGTVPTDSGSGPGPGSAACFDSASAPAAPTGGSFPAVVIASPTTWWVVSPGTGATTVDVTSNGGGSWTDVTAAGLGSGGRAETTGTDLTLVGAAGPLVAWAKEVTTADQSAPSTLQTTDGGLTWSPLEHLDIDATAAVPGASATSPSCTGDQLAATLGRSGVGLGHVGQTIVFTNVSTSACTLYGYPGVAGLDGAGRQIVQATRTPSGYLGGLWNTPNGPPPTVALAPGEVASALVEGLDDQVGSMPCVQLSGLLVTAPNTTRSVEFPSAPSDCDGLEVHPVVPGTSGTEGS
jgi:hypothetical protein